MDIMSYLLGQNSGGAKKGLKVIVVDELPTTGEADILYLVPKQDTGDNDIFEEWLWIEEDWEKIGTTDIDLSNYYTKGETLDITGLLSNLTTTSKTNLVSAINELAGNSGGLPKIVTNNIDNDTNVKNADDGIYQIENTSGVTTGILIVNGENKSGSMSGQLYITLLPSGNNDYDEFRFRMRAKSQYGNYSTFNTFKIQAKKNGGNAYPYDWNSGTTIVRESDLYRWYGSKVISNLTTTNKASLVDAINEVNPKGLTGYDASKTQTLKNINGTLTWVDD